MAMSVFMIHANIEFRENMIYIFIRRRCVAGITEIHTAKPTRVAMDELQLQDLKSIEAAHSVSLGQDHIESELTSRRCKTER